MLQVNCSIRKETNMPNQFAKTRKADQPYAIYQGPGITWHVIKTYKMPSSETKDQYARWMVAAKSDATFGDFEYGDTYKREVTSYGRLVAADPEWIAAYRPGFDAKLPTPAEYMWQVTSA
jgi:hypothetical protein